MNPSDGATSVMVPSSLGASELDRMSLNSSSTPSSGLIISSTIHHPIQRSICHQMPQTLAPISHESLYSANGFLHTDAGDDAASQGDSLMKGEAEVKATYKISPIALFQSKEELVWDAPPLLCSPLTGIYHSGYPREEHFSYLKTLNLKSVLSLVNTESEPLRKFLHKEGIDFYNIKMQNTLDGISTDLVVDALEVLLAKAQHPILFFSSLGKHRVGCVLGALRKVTSSWAFETIVEEYHSIAGYDIRPSVANFIISNDVSEYGDWFKGIYKANVEDNVEIMPETKHFEENDLVEGGVRGQGEGEE